MWKPVPGYEGYYEASDTGEIRGVRGYNGRGKRILAGAVGRNGYIYVNLNRDNDRGRIRTVHSIIALTFLGPRPAGLDVCHLDGNRKNNAPRNLRYDTRKGNMADTVRSGRIARGTRQGANKHSEATVLAVKAALTAGRSYTQIKAEYGLPISTIQAIKQGKTWAWLTGENA